jgi:hypothetical protein
MNQHKFTAFAALIALAVAGLLPSVSAGPLTYSVDFGSAGSPLPASRYPQVPPLPTHQTSLGTLADVTLSLSSTAAITDFVVNTCAAAVKTHHVSRSINLEATAGLALDVSANASPGARGSNSGFDNMANTYDGKLPLVALLAGLGLLDFGLWRERRAHQGGWSPGQAHGSAI